MIKFLSSTAVLAVALATTPALARDGGGAPGVRAAAEGSGVAVTT